MKTIGLCMIVKNEAHVILRCLDSVRPLVDYILIEDTGSNDGTQDIIRDWLDRENQRGVVFDEPWRDFAYNRTLALARLRKNAEIDYALTIDADDVLVLEQGFDLTAFKTELTADLYDVLIRLGNISYTRPQISSNRHEFRYRAILHEFLESPPGEISRVSTAGFYIRASIEGGRSQNKDKYRNDAQLLIRALETEQDPFLRSRYTFYMAQSWRDCGEHERALVAYLDRAGQGYWDEEVFFSLYRAGQLKEALGHPDVEIIGTYLKAFEACPRRTETLHAASRYCRATNKFHQGYMFAKQGLAIPQPWSALFGESWIYDYGLLDEFAVNAYWIGHYKECVDACERLLHEGKMPETMRQRVEENAKFASDKLRHTASEVDPSQATTSK